MNTISWTSPTAAADGDQPAPAFERLFGDGGSEATRAQRKEDAASSTSSRRSATLQSRWARAIARSDDYLDNVREIERRIQQAEHSTAESSSSTSRSACPRRSRSTRR
jgi:hypothetical protein